MRTNEQRALINKVLGAILLAASALILLGFSCEGSSIDFRPRIGEGQRRQQEPPPPPKELLAGIFVDVNSKAVKPDGKSWNRAFRNISDGVNAAPAGGKVIIAHGRYLRPAVDLTDKKDIALEGGYEPGDQYVKPVEEYTDKNRVVLDGDGQAQWLVRIAGTAQNINIRGNFEFRNVNGVSAVIIEGTAAQNIKNVTLAYGMFTKNDAGMGAGHFGGGLRIVHAENVVLDHLTAVENRAQDGGFLHAADVRGLTMIKSKWEKNHAIYGGGATHLSRISALNNSDTEALANTAVNEGGAMWLGDLRDVELKEVTFRGNGKGHSASGGALYVNNSHNLTFSDLEFLGNDSGAAPGGAVHVQQSSEITFALAGRNIAQNTGHQGGAFNIEDSTAVRIAGGIFRNNLATGGGMGAALGGAIYISTPAGIVKEELTIENASFVGNKAQYTAGMPDEYIGGAINIDGIRHVILKNLIFENNEVKNQPGQFGFGGALAINFRQPATAQNQVEIDDNRFIGNSVDGNGGALYATGNLRQVLVRNCEFRENTARVFGGALVLNGKSTTQFEFDANTRFVGNRAQAPNGGGVALLVLNNNPTPANSGKATFLGPLANFEENNSLNDIGKIARVSAQGPETVDPLAVPRLVIAPPNTYETFLDLAASGFNDGYFGRNVFVDR